MRDAKRISTYVFLALYPVLPGYFRIAGIPSYKLLMILYSGVYYLSLFASKRIRISKRNAKLVGCLFGIWTLINIRHASFSGIVNALIEYVLVLGAMLDYFDSREKVEGALRILVRVGTVMCFFGLFEFVAKKNLFAVFYNGKTTDTTPVLQYRGIFARSEATFGHSIPFGIYLSLNAIIAMYLYQKYKRRGYLFSYVLLVITLFTTISRGPIVVFIITQLLFLAMMGFKRLILGIATAIPVAAIVLVIMYYAFPTIFRGVSFIYNVVAGVFSENALQRAGVFQNQNPFEYRLALYEIAGNLVKGKELFGTGNVIDTFSYGYNLFSLSGTTHYSIDNAYLSWLVKYGVIGLIVNLIPVVTALFISWRYRKMDREFVLFFATVLTLGLNWFSVASLGDSRIWLILFAMIWSEGRPNRTGIRMKRIRNRLLQMVQNS
ncbi:MAG: O-antigen ligase family protein [Solobacterium sp.]|nr:O-antigen ligase family protein [Solobacterium sp.]